jgi:hypothetical protein
MLEIAQPAMDQLTRSRRGGRSEIALFDQTDRQTATGGIAGDPDAIDAAADHQHVENLGVLRICRFGKHGATAESAAAAAIGRIPRQLA